ncbi:hypothetical protein B0H15DRAFT_804276 [Mycena belliarum]|uniref:Ribonuclease H1 N-terminal domain-containing protein n=1 Tax=Mycena belliarum TaxID=1033014 RepID=A0AAD6TUE5_9AGAR|nr:hypothetical protein B0H15DRAFT_804276 [Mycena belliae]
MAANDPDNPALLALLARLAFDDHNPDCTPSPASPSTPSSQPPPYTTTHPHTFPSHRPRTHTDVRHAPTIYIYESPTKRGVTTEWAIAGAATQGISSGHVRAVQPRKKQPASKKVAYAVFCGLECGVFLTWDEAKRQVNGISNCIFRGYTSVSDARAAFAYAEAHSWTRIAQSTSVPAIPRLPEPITSSSLDCPNPLNGSETIDDRWYVVYKGIQPGVYRSHLECQLNCLGVRKSVHQSIVGKLEALRKFEAAVRQGNTEALLPTYYPGVDPDDPFL